MASTYEVSILVPVYNERHNLPGLIVNLRRVVAEHAWEAEVVLVDDNSTDGSGALIDELAAQWDRIVPVHRAAGMNGMGFALIEGFEHARGKFIVWTMGDGSDDPNSIGPMINVLRSDCDLVLGSRYIAGGSSGDQSRLKAFLSRSYSQVVRMLFGIPVHDVTNAFRAFTREVWLATRPGNGDFAIAPEMAIKAHRLGFRLGEVPTVYRERRTGVSKFCVRKAVTRYSTLILRHRFASAEVGG